MGAWIWLLLLAVGLASFQLLLYRRLQTGTVDSERSESRETSSTTELRADRSHVLTDDPSVQPADDTRGGPDEWVCSFCGSHNEADPAYTYCHGCVRRLR